MFKIELLHFVLYYGRYMIKVGCAWELNCEVKIFWFCLRLQQPDALRDADPKRVTTLRIKAEDGNQTFVVKMHFTETIGKLREYLAKTGYGYLYWLLIAHNWSVIKSLSYLSNYPSTHVLFYCTSSRYVQFMHKFLFFHVTGLWFRESLILCRRFLAVHIAMTRQHLKAVVSYLMLLYTCAGESELVAFSSWTRNITALAQSLHHAVVIVKHCNGYWVWFTSL